MYGKFTGKLVSCINSYEGQTRDGRAYEKREYLFEVTGMRPYKFVFSMFKYVDGEALAWPVVGDVADVSCNCVAAQSKDGRWFNAVSCYKYEKRG